MPLIESKPIHGVGQDVLNVYSAKMKRKKRESERERDRDRRRWRFSFSQISLRQSKLLSGDSKRFTICGPF